MGGHFEGQERPETMGYGSSRALGATPPQLLEG